MKRESLVGMLSGTVVADETWIGGKPLNRHGYRTGQGGQGRTDKQPVMALVSRDTGEVRSFMLQRVNRDNVSAVRHANVNPDAELNTDENYSYTMVGRTFPRHRTVNHVHGESSGMASRRTTPRATSHS